MRIDAQIVATVLLLLHPVCGASHSWLRPPFQGWPPEGAFRTNEPKTHIRQIPSIQPFTRKSHASGKSQYQPATGYHGSGTPKQIHPCLNPTSPWEPKKVSTRGSALRS